MIIMLQYYIMVQYIQTVESLRVHINSLVFSLVQFGPRSLLLTLTIWQRWHTRLQTPCKRWVRACIAGIHCSCMQFPHIFVPLILLFCNTKMATHYLLTLVDPSSCTSMSHWHSDPWFVSSHSWIFPIPHYSGLLNLIPWPSTLYTTHCLSFLIFHPWLLNCCFSNLSPSSFPRRQI